MDIEDVAARFVEVARAYCQLAEGKPLSESADMAAARRFMVRLYAAALDLSLPECDDVALREVSSEAWGTVFKRFSGLPVNYYNQCFDPLLEPPVEPSLGDLADDLADIWRDVKNGLILFDAGHIPAAVYEWRVHFNMHWGRHAARALYVLESWNSSCGRSD